jgi:hypothetical protein
MKLQKFIEEKLGIQESKPDEALEILAGKKEELKEAIKQIELLEPQIIKQIMKDHCIEWEERLKKDFFLTLAK